jgi:hypothetical protein
MTRLVAVTRPVLTTGSGDLQMRLYLGYAFMYAIVRMTSDEVFHARKAHDATATA